MVTLMNRHGEAQILGRWRHVNWTETLPRLTAMARTFGALVVLDHGAGGGYGGVAKDHLEKDGVKVLAIKTAVVGTKAQVVEQCRADVQWERIKVLRGEHADQLRHELTLFQGIKRQLHGQEVTLYEGPQIKGEHDDCVISLCLANWGRVHGEHALVEEQEDLQEWVRLNERLRRQFPYRFVSGPPASGPFFGSSPFFGGGL